MRAVWPSNLVCVFFFFGARAVVRQNWWVNMCWFTYLSAWLLLTYLLYSFNFGFWFDGPIIRSSVCEFPLHCAPTKWKQHTHRNRNTIDGFCESLGTHWNWNRRIYLRHLMPNISDSNYVSFILKHCTQYLSLFGSSAIIMLRCVGRSFAKKTKQKAARVWLFQHLHHFSTIRFQSLWVFGCLQIVCNICNNHMCTVCRLRFSFCSRIWQHKHIHPHAHTHTHTQKQHTHQHPLVT